MAKKIEFTDTVKFGDKIVDQIEIYPLFFVELVAMSSKMIGSKKPLQVLQRERIRKQVHFKVAGERVIPDDVNLSALPAATARLILDNLDTEQGDEGSIVLEGDGVSTPIVYRLGTALEMKDSKGTTIVIRDLEFLAATYGEIEDALACENEITRALELLRSVAKPLDAPSLMRLPGWAIDKITNLDGVGIVQKVAPAF